jgi:hypothetical protein
MSNTILRDVARSKKRMLKKCQEKPSFALSQFRRFTKEQRREFVEENKQEFLEWFDWIDSIPPINALKYFDMTCRSCENLQIGDCPCYHAFNLIIQMMKREFFSCENHARADDQGS